MRIKALSAAIAVGGLMMTSALQASDFHFRYPVYGAIGGTATGGGGGGGGGEPAPEPAEGLAMTWPEFADANGLFYSDWNSTGWLNKGLTDLPSDPYPLDAPTGTIDLRNNSLTYIDGLRNITSLGGALYLSGNPLTSASALDNLTSAAGLSLGDSIADPQLPSLTTLTGILSLRNNATGALSGINLLDSVRILDLESAGITYLSGLNGLTLITRSDPIRLNNNPLVEVSGLNGLTSLKYASSGSLFIQYTPMEIFSGFNSVVVSEGGISMNNNTNFRELTGFSNLEHVKGTMNMRSNALNNIIGLSKLRIVDGAIYLMDNQLVDVSALDALTSAGSIYIGSNSIQSPSFASLTTVSDFLDMSYNTIGVLDGINTLSSVAKMKLNNAGITVFSGMNGLTQVTGTDGRYVFDLTGNPITEFSGVNALTELNQTFYDPIKIEGTPLEIFSGFMSLNSVQGNIRVRNNPNFTTLTGMSVLATVGGNFYLDENNLQSIPGLSSLTTVGGVLDLGGNSLTDVSSLDSLMSADSLNLDNNSIQSPSLASLTTLSDFLDLSYNNIGILDGVNSLSSVGRMRLNNAGITVFSGMNGLTQVTGTDGRYAFDLTGNPITEFSGVNALTELNQTNYDPIKIEGTPLEVFSGFMSLNSVQRNIRIRNNANFAALTGMPVLTTVGGAFYLDDNNLTDISGISNLTSVGANLDLTGNPNLIDITPIQNISSAGGILLDPDISTRTGFVKLPSTSPICQASMTAAFPTSTAYAQQSEICL